MKIIKISFIIIFFSFSYGCSEEQPYENEKKYVAVLAGDISYISVKTDLTQGKYTLISDNQNIATATFDDQPGFICISTYKDGNATIRLIETDNNKIICEIFVYARYFNSREIIDLGIPTQDHPGIIVKTTNPIIEKEIINELRESSMSITGTIYTFNQHTKKIHNEY